MVIKVSEEGVSEEHYQQDYDKQRSQEGKKQYHQAFLTSFAVAPDS